MPPSPDFMSNDIDMKSTSKKHNQSRSKSRHGRHNYLLNAYRSKKARRNAGKGKDDLASQMSKMSISKSIRKAPRARSVMHVDPTRVQQTRKVKDCATGIFSAAKLAERKIQDAKPIAPKRSQDKGRQSMPPEPLVVDPKDPFAHIRIDQNRENENDIVCDVCLDDNDEEGDEILICEICFVGVHQTCYGGKFKNQLPPAEQPFYCERCEYLI
jgi:hypothetical protein